MFSVNLNLEFKTLGKYSGIHPFFIWQQEFGEVIEGVFLNHAHSKQLFTGHLYDACAKTPDIVLIKIMTSAPVVEIGIACFICYLLSLYEIKLGHCFCPEFVGHVTNQNILVDSGNFM